MRDRLVLCVLVALGVGSLGGGAGCGKEIGDPCIIATDCSPNGDRICIDSTGDQEGYCTVQGCDYATCPEEATCVRFFTGSFSNRTCDPTVANDPACSLDEFCPVEGHCVPRSSEIRFCMRTCGSDADCRDGYECRNLDLMRAHGGQPVLAPTGDGGAPPPVDDSAPKFCAKRP